MENAKTWNLYTEERQIIMKFGNISIKGFKMISVWKNSYSATWKESFILSITVLKHKLIILSILLLHFYEMICIFMKNFHYTNMGYW